MSVQIVLFMIPENGNIEISINSTLVITLWCIYTRKYCSEIKGFSTIILKNVKKSFGQLTEFRHLKVTHSFIPCIGHSRTGRKQEKSDQ